jgi:hypothetical protein
MSTCLKAPPSTVLHRTEAAFQMRLRESEECFGPRGGAGGRTDRAVFRRSVRPVLNDRRKMGEAYGP